MKRHISLQDFCKNFIIGHQSYGRPSGQVMRTSAFDVIRVIRIVQRFPAGPKSLFINIHCVTRMDVVYSWSISTSGIDIARSAISVHFCPSTVFQPVKLSFKVLCLGCELGDFNQMIVISMHMLDNMTVIYLGSIIRDEKYLIFFNPSALRKRNISINYYFDTFFN